MTSASTIGGIAAFEVEAKASPVESESKSRPTRSASDERHRILQPLRKTHLGLERPPFGCVALVLQGGGALGAFQAGV
jgi:predicted acylesterase/phospholipase RssA